MDAMQPEVVDTVVQEITTLHNEMAEMAKRTIDTAIYIGELLYHQKRQLKHGEFIPWVKKNLPFGDEQARKYIRLYQKQERLNPNCNLDLGIDSALKEIRQAEKQEKEPQQENDSDNNGTCITKDLERLIESGRKYKTIYADPPWQYGNQATRSATNNHYGTMTVDEIAALPIADVVEDNAHLHLWTTNAFLFDARRVLEAWGFEYKSCFVWVKPSIGIGNYWRVSHEFLLFGIRGKLPFQDRSQRSWIEKEKTKHSSKPEKVRKIIEKVSPGPYLELFGRKAVDGWTVFGDEVAQTLTTYGCEEV
jgi:N6-adenosine-specific RNA methylase IME4